MRQLGADSNAKEKHEKMYSKNFEGATFWLNNQQDENEIQEAHPITKIQESVYQKSTEVTEMSEEY